VLSRPPFPWRPPRALPSAPVRGRRQGVLAVVGATLAVTVVVTGAAAGTTRDFDRPPLHLFVAVSDASATEGGALSFTVTLSGVPRGRVTVAYGTQDGSATAPDDYATASGTVVLDRLRRMRTVTVQAAGDSLDEVDETLAVTLSGGSGATIADGSGVGTILDDDPSPRIAAAGDIACDPGDANYHSGQGTGLFCRQRATSDLLVAGGYDAVLTLGDNQYEDGTLAKYNASYDPSWGRVKAITKPVPGNHEYQSGSPAGYFAYFGAAAGDPAKGWYSYDLGSWHVVALNSNCFAVACSAGSAQEHWLRADLAAHPTACTLAYWHHPRFSSGQHGSSTTYTAFWQALYDAGADLVLVGHDHDYERFAPQTPAGALDTARGLRQFVVGNGGKSLRAFGTIRPNSELRNSDTLGILELTLGPSGYAWRHVPAVGSFTDTGAADCD
jgi:acid phosphatase type 7